jgi:hypothetical protein
MDHKHFNALGPKEQTTLIVAAGYKARGLPAPRSQGELVEGDRTKALAAMIVRAGQRRRGELP